MHLKVNVKMITSLVENRSMNLTLHFFYQQEELLTLSKVSVQALHITTHYSNSSKIVKERSYKKEDSVEGHNARYHNHKATLFAASTKFPARECTKLSLLKSYNSFSHC